MGLSHAAQTEQELLLHSLLHQSQLFDKFKKKLILEEEAPKEEIIHVNELLLTEPMPLELLLNTYHTDSSAEEYLREIIKQEQHEGFESRLFVAGIARRYVGIYNFISYRDLIDIGMDGYQKGKKCCAGEDFTSNLSYIGWHVHRAIYLAYDQIPERRQIDIINENEVKYQLNEDYPSEGVIRLLEKTIQPRDQVLTVVNENEGNELRRSIIQEIKKHSSLSEKEEQSLFIKTKAGDETACSKIQESYAWLILAVCKEYDIYADYVQHLPDFDFLDFYLAGFHGIKTAILMYDERKEYDFSVFAAWNIHKVLLNSVRRRITENFILPSELGSMHQIWETYQKLAEHGEPTYRELKNKAEEEIEMVRQYLDPDPNPSIDKKISVKYEKAYFLNAFSPSREALKAIEEQKEYEVTDLEILKARFPDGLVPILSKASGIQLNPEQEKALIIQYKNGDLSAKRILVRANIQLAASIAQKYMKYNHSSKLYKELFLDGIEGVVQAVENYEAESEFLFRAYAAWYVHRMVWKTYSLQEREENSAEDVVQYLFPNVRI